MEKGGRFSTSIPYSPCSHGDQEIHVHLVAAVSNGLIAEYYDSNLNSLLGAMFKNHIELDNNGYISPQINLDLGLK